MPPEEKRKINLNGSCAKKRKNEDKGWTWHAEGARINFRTHQYLILSEYLGLGLGRKLYLPPLE